MFDMKNIPQSITNKINGLTWRCDDIGMSNATILLFEEMVLKIEKTSHYSKREQILLEWLANKLPVPSIIKAEIKDGYSFLLMSKLTGEMSCSDNNLKNIENTVKSLANSLKMLWQIDIKDCPCSNLVSEKLIQAKYNIENNLVNVAHFNPETFTTEGFKDVYDLFNFLDQNRPDEELIFSHGDFCFPNIFLSDCKTTGFLDWGTGGIADLWQDIALCVRSLRHNCTINGIYSEAEYLQYRALLFKELNIEPNEDKIRYFILLDELI